MFHNPTNKQLLIASCVASFLIGIMLTLAFTLGYTDDRVAKAEARKNQEITTIVERKVAAKKKLLSDLKLKNAFQVPPDLKFPMVYFSGKPGELTPVFEITEAGNYSLEPTMEKGCNQEAMIYLVDPFTGEDIHWIGSDFFAEFWLGPGLYQLRVECGKPWKFNVGWDIWENGNPPIESGR